MLVISNQMNVNVRESVMAVCCRPRRPCLEAVLCSGNCGLS